MTGVTVSTKDAEALRTPSDTVIVMVLLPERFKAGVMVTVRSDPLPPKTMLATGTRLVFDEDADTFRLAGSLSTSPIVKGIGLVDVSSSIVRLLNVLMVGGSLTLLTVRTKVLFALNTPSKTVMVMVVSPCAFGTRTIEMVRFVPVPPRLIFSTGTRSVLEDCTDNANPFGGVSRSPIVKEIGEIKLSSSTVKLEMALMVGGVFIPLTVKVNSSVALNSPSLTVTRITAEPD